MSDVTNVRRAEEALAEHGNPYPIDRAKVHAALAVSRALRELDTTTRQGLRAVVEAIAPPPGERWLTWADDTGRQALSVNHIRSIFERADDTVVEMADGENITVPLTYAHVALQVGI